MVKLRKQGFTLIELIAVLVIMAILALIVTPLVMNIIRKTRISADRRSIDAYGRSIELAIASYLLDTGKFPTEVSQLTIEYSGNKVECTTTQINPDSSAYLAGCKVNNREVSNYTYGSDKTPTYKTYKVGDTVTYNNIDFYVIKDSGAKEDTVILLKAEPLSVDEVKNQYLPESFGGLTNSKDGYGAIFFGSSTEYSLSYVKAELDAWIMDKFSSNDIKQFRLITFDELRDSFGFEYKSSCSTCNSMNWIATENTPDWIKNYSYWTMSNADDSTNMWVVAKDIIKTSGLSEFYCIRPVVELYKSALN